jgi:RecB family exonuclease
MRAIVAGVFSVTLFAPTAPRADEVERVLFLLVEPGQVVASNTQTGRFDRLDLDAKERVIDYKAANAVAVVVTNQRFAAYGALAGGWQTLRRKAGEQTEQIEAEDYGATVVTDDRILNFNGRTGAWNQTRRSVQFR